MTGDYGSQPVGASNAILIAPGAVIGYDPEGPVTITTLAVDTDYLIEHLFWQHLAMIPDRDAARDLAAKLPWTCRC